MSVNPEVVILDNTKYTRDSARKLTIDQLVPWQKHQVDMWRLSWRHHRDQDDRKPLTLGELADCTIAKLKEVVPVASWVRALMARLLLEFGMEFAVNASSPDGDPNLVITEAGMPEDEYEWDSMEWASAKIVFAGLLKLAPNSNSDSKEDSVLPTEPKESELSANDLVPKSEIEQILGQPFAVAVNAGTLKFSDLADLAVLTKKDLLEMLDGNEIKAGAVERVMNNRGVELSPNTSEYPLEEKIAAIRAMRKSSASDATSAPPIQEGEKRGMPEQAQDPKNTPVENVFYAVLAGRMKAKGIKTLGDLADMECGACMATIGGNAKTRKAVQDWLRRYNLNFVAPAARATNSTFSGETPVKIIRHQPATQNSGIGIHKAPSGETSVYRVFSGAVGGKLIKAGFPSVESVTSHTFTEFKQLYPYKDRRSTSAVEASLTKAKLSFKKVEGEAPSQPPVSNALPKVEKVKRVYTRRKVVIPSEEVATHVRELQQALPPEPAHQQAIPAQSVNDGATGVISSLMQAIVNGSLIVDTIKTQASGTLSNGKRYRIGFDFSLEDSAIPVAVAD